MKKLNQHYKYFLLFAINFFLLANKSMAQEDSAAPVPIVKLQYFNQNNSMQFLMLESSLKKGKVFTPQKNKTYHIYLDSSNEANLIGAVKTNENGKAKTVLPVTLKSAWETNSQHTFIVKEGDEEMINDYAVTKAKISIDTATEDSIRSITVAVQKLENNEWVPAADVEMKIGIERLGGILSAGDEETYTTDSSGTVVVELKKNNLPGDQKGNYVIAARVDDNDLYGNLLVQKTVNWGVARTVNNHFFDKRTLWSTRFNTPVWLLLMAYTIIIGVWGTLIYLVMQFIKLRKMGKSISEDKSTEPAPPLSASL